MSAYDYYIRFNTIFASPPQSIAYLRKMIYFAKAIDTETTESFVEVFTKAEIDALTFIDTVEKNYIKKAFDLGLKSLYIRGVVDTDFGTGDILGFNKFINADDEIVNADSLAYTIVMSPLLDTRQEIEDGFSGVVVNSVKAIPTLALQNNEVLFYDFYDTDITESDCKALGIMGMFLNNDPFLNMQLREIVGYNSVPATNFVLALKEAKITFLLNDGQRSVLGMFSAGLKEITYPYVAELWRFNVRESLRTWLQLFTPTYINDNIYQIEELIDRESEAFVNIGYFESYKNTIAPLRENQSAADIDSFLVNNVSVEYVTSGAIWSINVNVKEA